MNDSFSLGRILGIEIKLHKSMPILLIIIWLGLMNSGLGGLQAATLLLSLELIVLLHELGHSVAAKAYGLTVVDITFWPLGGMARMSQIPENTKIETVIALAGPAVNFVLAGLALPLAFLLQGDLRELAFLFANINLVLGGFNLLPAFPMDGGRVLRALLAHKGDWLGATEKAVRVGRWIALAMVVAVFTTDLSFMLIFIAGFVWFAGQRELMAMRMRHTGSPFDMSGLQNMMRRAAGGAGPLGGPGPRPGQNPFGEDPRDASWADSEEAHQAQAPQQVSERAQSDKKGFSDAELDDLEGFHGSLKNFNRDDS